MLQSIQNCKCQCHRQFKHWGRILWIFAGSYMGYNTQPAEVRNPGPPPQLFEELWKNSRFSQFFSIDHTKNPVVDPRSIELTAHSLFVVRISEILAHFRSHLVVTSSISRVPCSSSELARRSSSWRWTRAAKSDICGNRGCSVCLLRASVGLLRGSGLVRAKQRFVETK